MSKETWAHNPVGVYLMSCYAYEVLDNPFLADADFDELGRFIADNYESLNHRHKYIIDRERCAHTSGITIPYREWPSIIIGAATQFATGTIPIPAAYNVEDFI